MKLAFPKSLQIFCPDHVDERYRPPLRLANSDRTRHFDGEPPLLLKKVEFSKFEPITVQRETFELTYWMKNCLAFRRSSLHFRVLWFPVCHSVKPFSVYYACVPVPLVNRNWFPVRAAPSLAADKVIFSLHLISTINNSQGGLRQSLGTRRPRLNVLHRGRRVSALFTFVTLLLSSVQ